MIMFQMSLIIPIICKIYALNVTSVARVFIQDRPIMLPNYGEKTRVEGIPL